MNQPSQSNQADKTDAKDDLSNKRLCRACGAAWDRSIATCPDDGTGLLSPIETDPAFSKYEFIEVCGSGGMGVVYKARQTILDKIVAIKMLHSGLLSSEAVRRFQIEGKSASMMEHPYIIKVHDLGVSASGPYMILEYVKGRTLAHVLQFDGPLCVERFLRVFIQVCSALEHAHSRGVFHRDLKPTNIMLTRSFNNEEEIRIMDFGIAKLISDAGQEGNVEKLTRTGEALGSPSYMSPEQAQGGKIDARSDLYSLGCVMFESLTGAAPFNKTTSLETIMAQISEQPITMTQALLGTTKFDESLETIVSRLLQKDPDRRYQSMQELQNHLIAVRDGKGLGQFVYKQDRPRSYRLIAISCISAIALAATAYISWALLAPSNNHEKQTAPAPAPTIDVAGLPNPIAAAVANNDKEMTIGGEGFTVDEDLAALKDDKTAESISLRKADISGLGLRYLARIPTLKILKLSNSRVHTLEYLADAQSLEVLDLDDTLIGDYQLQQISNLHLKTLELSNTSVRTLNGIRNMKSLTNLQLNFCKHLNAEGMSVIGQLRNLEQLALTYTPITDADLANIVNLHRLQSLRLNGCKRLSDVAVENLKKKLPTDCIVEYDAGHTASSAAAPYAPGIQTLIDARYQQTKDKAIQLQQKAYRLWANRRYKDSLALYKQVLPVFQNIEKKSTDDWSHQADCLRMIGNCHYSLQQLQPAVPFYEKAIDILTKHPDSKIYDQLPYWCYELGILYDNTNRKTEGLAMHVRSNDLFNNNHPIYSEPGSKETCDAQDAAWERNKAINLFSIYTLSATGSATAARDEHLRNILQTGLDICSKDSIMKNALLTANYYQALADLYTVEGQRTSDKTQRNRCYQLALDNYKHARYVAMFNKQDPHLPNHLGAALIGIGSIDLALEQYGESEEIFKDILEHNQDKASRIVALRNLVAICHAQNRKADVQDYTAQLSRLEKK